VTHKTDLDDLLRGAQQSLSEKDPRMPYAEVQVTRAEIDACEKELAALRQRADDAELMLRDIMWRCGDDDNPWGRLSSGGDWMYSAWDDNEDKFIEFRVPNDGTGFPILTDEIRAALREAEK